MRLYSISEIYLLEHSHETAQRSVANISEVTNDNVDDALFFQSRRQVRSFHSFLAEGMKGYYAYVNGKCVHRSWVVAGPATVRLHKFFPLRIAADEFFIRSCETAVSERGKNIFAHVLSHIAFILKGKHVLIAVDKGNEASMKSIHKAGFEIIGHHRIRIIFGCVKITQLPLQ